MHFRYATQHCEKVLPHAHKSTVVAVFYRTIKEVLVVPASSAYGVEGSPYIWASVNDVPSIRNWVATNCPGWKYQEVGL